MALRLVNHKRNKIKNYVKITWTVNSRPPSIYHFMNDNNWNFLWVPTSIKLWYDTHTPRTPSQICSHFLSRQINAFHCINFIYGSLKFINAVHSSQLIREYSVVLNSMSSDKKDQIRLPIVGVDFIIIINIIVSFQIKKNRFDKNLFIWQNVLNLIEAAGDMFPTIKSS